MTDWLLTDAEIEEEVAKWPIGYRGAISMGALAELGKVAGIIEAETEAAVKGGAFGLYLSHGVSFPYMVISDAVWQQLRKEAGLE